MFKRYYLYLLLLLSGMLLSTCGGIKPQAPGMGLQDKNLNWNKEKIESGLFWHQLETQQLYDRQQRVNYLEVRNKRQVLLAYEENTLRSVPELARQHKALAAVNGTFTEGPAGGETATFIKTDWSMVNSSAARSLIEAPTDFTEGIFSITYRRRAHIDTTRTVTYYELADNLRDVVFAGPILVFEGRRANLASTDFNDQRMARTCACTTDRDRLLLVTVDGGTPDTPGMTAAEVRELLLALDCVNAVHLAGGQATTMFIRGYGDNGVVNQPVGGLSQVSNAILIK